MSKNPILLKVIIGVVVAALLGGMLFVAYRMYTDSLNDNSVSQTASSTDKFKGMTPEEIKEVLDSITPTGSGEPMSEEEISAALASVRNGDAGTSTEPAATPEGESRPLTEQEIKAELDAIMSGKEQDSDTEITQQ